MTEFDRPGMPRNTSASMLEEQAGTRAGVSPDHEPETHVRSALTYTLGPCVCSLGCVEPCQLCNLFRLCCVPR